MSEELDLYGFPVEPPEQMQQVMLAFFDLMDEAERADFPAELRAELNGVRRRFIDAFEARFPGYGKGRALWR